MSKIIKFGYGEYFEVPEDFDINILSKFVKVGYDRSSGKFKRDGKEKRTSIEVFFNAEIMPKKDEEVKE